MIVITRRTVITGLGTVSLLAATAARFDLGLVTQAMAQASTAELLAPGPIEEQSIGKADAPVTVIEYASMTCGHCARFHKETYPEFKKRYVDTGKARYILREFPLDPLSAGAFMLARCAGKDRYFPMVETLFGSQNTWVVQKPIEPLMAVARQAGFTQQTFDACLKDQKMLEGIEAVRNRGSEKFGVNSTPTFFINGKRIAGAMSIEDLAKEIDPLVKG